MATKWIILIAIAVVGLGVGLGVGLTYDRGAPPLSPPTIAYSPLSFNFTAIQGGDNPEDQTLEIWNSGGGSRLNWRVSDDADWLCLSPLGGFSTGEHNAVNVRVNISGMTAGSYNATITITGCCPTPTNSPQHVPVSLTINPPPLTIGYSPPSFHFAAALGGSNPEAQTLSIWNAGGGTLDWVVSDDASWLTLNPTSGSSTGEHDAVTVSVNISGLTAGTHNATITISAAGAANTPQTVAVTLTIGGSPTIAYSPDSFSFTATEGGANPEDQTLEIWNSGGGSRLNWQVSDDADWLSLSPPGGVSTGEHNAVNVRVNISGMTAGSYNATITITACCPYTPNSPQTVPVSLTMNPHDTLSVHFIDVGKADSILIDLGETEVLIDGGGKWPGVVDYLNNYVDGELEVMVATHPHEDHIGGLIAVLNTFEVNEIWLNGDTHTTLTYDQFMAAVGSEGAEVHEARRGDQIETGGLTFIVLNPVDLSGSINNNCIVLSLSYGEVEFLFTGDAEEEAEESMLTAGIVPNVEILKVGHHGSRTSSSEAFLEAVQPEVAIIMEGECNPYGLPHPETITALNGIGAEIYRTGVNDTILVTTDGVNYTVETEKYG